MTYNKSKKMLVFAAAVVLFSGVALAHHGSGISYDTWTDGQSIIQLNEVQPNVAVGPEKFAKPVPPAVK
jgi:hypothetical protein